MSGSRWVGRSTKYVPTSTYVLLLEHLVPQQQFVKIRKGGKQSGQTEMNHKLLLGVFVITVGVVSAYDGAGKPDDDLKDIDKRDGARIIKGSKLKVQTLNNLLDEIGDYSRKCAIGLDNESGNKWHRASRYFFSGTSDEVLPEELKHKHAVLFPARKKTGLLAGAVGVMCWCDVNSAYTVCLMFSVPYDYNLYKNWWNVKLYDGCESASFNIYNELYYRADPFVGDGTWKERDLGNGLSVRGSMSSSGAATLEVHVEKE